MSSKDLKVKSEITMESVARYVVEEITTESPVEAGLRLATTKLPNGGMISGSDVGALLAILAKSVNAKFALEIGTFTGYTALKVAAALPTDGRLVCCDINKEWTDMGRPFWKEAGVLNRIDLRLAPATETLNLLLQAPVKYDFAFIDADKGGYDSYYELCLQLLRPGGLIVLDNMLWSGTVADLRVNDTITKTLRKLNEKIGRDSRVDACLLTVGDGLMLARKK